MRIPVIVIGNREIDLRPRRVIADRAARSDDPPHRGILMTSWRLGRSPSGDVGQLAPVPLFSTRAEATEFEPSKTLKKITAKSWRGESSRAS